ncbi:MAG: hypothetical protein IPQ07_00025 [Myxococcales bacterium]|nr:hypothetical protein [Myxococcales bacterium]
MRKGPILLAAGALALVGFGVWLGRSSSGTRDADAAPVSQAAPRTAALPSARVSAAPPTLARRAEPTPALAADLADADPKIRRAAVRELARDRDADPAALLVASRDPDLETGIAATEALGRLHAAGAVPAAELIARASDHALNERVRVTAMNGLATTPSPEAAAFLADLLARGDTAERANAAILVGHQELEIAVPALIRALGDSSEQVRANAAESLRSRSRGRDFGTDAAAWQAWWQSRPR